MSKPWAGIGAWAAEAEREEEEQRAAAESSAASAGDSKSFPSLKEAVTTKPKKKKMTLSEFYSASGARNTDHKGLTPDEMLQLPTGPKQRSPEEMQYSRLGGGFSSFNRSGPPSGGMMRDRSDTDGSWGGGGRKPYGGGGYDDERRGPTQRRVPDIDQPSRADEVDNWAKAKKSLPSFDQGRQSRYGGLGASGGGGVPGGVSRADEVDSWTSYKKPAPPPSRSSTFGSGFRDSGPEPDRWTRGGSFSTSGVMDERPRLVLDPPKGNISGASDPQPVVRTNKPNPFGAARPREEVLAEKGLDWKKLDSEIEAKRESSQSSRPTSAHSSRPSSAQSSRSEAPGLQGVENVMKPRQKVNPFGNAKPREVLLEERGQDWRKIDLELERRRIDRPETEEEKLLKEEIDQLKGAEKESSASTSQESGPGPVADQTSLHTVILQKERDLEMLICDLDDKVRFGQKAVDRPGSGAGRVASLSGRSHSRSGSFDESRSVESMDRPQSRGAEVWARPVDDRRSFQGGRERGFFGDRSRSRERW